MPGDLITLGNGSGFPAPLLRHCHSSLSSSRFRPNNQGTSPGATTAAARPRPRGKTWGGQPVAVALRRKREPPLQRACASDASPQRAHPSNSALNFLVAAASIKSRRFDHVP